MFVRIIAFAVLCQLLAPFTSSALVVEPDGNGNEMPNPSAGFIGRLNGSSGVIIAPQMVMATKHQIDQWRKTAVFVRERNRYEYPIPFIYREDYSTTYFPVSYAEHPLADLIIVGFAETFPGFHQVVRSIPAVGAELTLGGWGRVRGTRTPAQYGNGWDWAGWGLRWGKNIITSSGNGLFYTFNAPGTGGAVPFETIATMNDSGSGMFVIEDGVLRLAGITTTASIGSYTPPGSTTSVDYSFYNGTAGGLGIRSEPYYSWIAAISPLSILGGAPTPSATATPMRTATATRSATPTSTPTRTATATSTPSRSATPTLTPSRTATPTATRTSTRTPTPTGTSFPTATRTSTPSPTANTTHTVTPTQTASPSPTTFLAPSAVPSLTPTLAATATKALTTQPPPPEILPSLENLHLKLAIRKKLGQRTMSLMFRISLETDVDIMPMEAYQDSCLLHIRIATKKNLLGKEAGIVVPFRQISLAQRLPREGTSQIVIQSIAQCVNGEILSPTIKIKPVRWKKKRMKAKRFIEQLYTSILKSN